MHRTLFYVPIVCFVIIMGVLAWAFTLEDASRLPSVLIDRPFPAFELPIVKTGVLVTEQDLKGRPALVNVWATWCANCLIEHPLFMELKDEVPIFGINYNDDTDKAKAWLRRHRDPYQFSIVDIEGKLAIDLGVYGAPETYVIDAEGAIQYRHVGIVSREDWELTLAPLLSRLESR
ncbi:MAG: DsbE family thiol:disulfide interchange protein [Gammaproteobacteria bacterium]|uniref:DsbE family thiol:disulfide interchange protein n=1 Tax=OM182 bacterium MED-G24 TaxID=1986255 RepID=A0A2A5WVL5_9GAMM|nr:DsbE family thiol:disulfide interchange protein [Gammaproteobacteria bacterium]PDH40600.1 MAG: DsbE family thiol:disulfide interchange protein [OM182 bacterium MED-G24]RPG26047.1 MAG: DsbE family thiol:disulfide interchange protein [Gammaproteobacteria bacterium TMED50]